MNTFYIRNKILINDIYLYNKKKLIIVVIQLCFTFSLYSQVKLDSGLIKQSELYSSIERERLEFSGLQDEVYRNIIQYQFQSAIDTLKKIIDGFKMNKCYVSDIYYDIGRLYNKMNEFDSAVFYFKKSIELSHTDNLYFNNKAYSELAQLYKKGNKLDSALKYFDYYTNLESDFYFNYWNRALCHYENKNFKKSYEDFQKVISVVEKKQPIESQAIIYSDLFEKLTKNQDEKVRIKIYLDLLELFISTNNYKEEIKLVRKLSEDNFINKLCIDMNKINKESRK